MKTYNVTPELAGISGKRKVFRILLGGASFAVLWAICFQLLFPNPTRGLSASLVDVVTIGVIWAGLDAVLFMKRRFTYDVVVTDDLIAIGPRPKRLIRKDEVRTVSECDGNFLVAPGLRISKYGSIGTWFWGGIWIPKTLPEYESVKSLALSWQSRARI
jgi:hypothetical protein